MNKKTSNLRTKKAERKNGQKQENALKVARISKQNTAVSADQVQDDMLNLMESRVKLEKEYFSKF